MPKMSFPMWSKLKSLDTETGKSRKDRGNSLSTKSSVDEEYLKAFRSNSYEEMWDKVQGQLGITSATTSTGAAFSPSSLSSPFYLDLSEYLLEPRQETLKSMIESLNFHLLLVEYFEASLRACNICELLLRSIKQARSDYRKIKRVIKMSKRVLVLDHDQYDDHSQLLHNDQCSRAVFRELGAIALLKNPLSIISPAQYHDIRDGYMVLLHKLTSKGKKIKRREKLKRLCKKVGGAGLVVTHSALLIALLVFAFHGVFGIVAAPALVGCSSVYLAKKKKKKRAMDSQPPRLPGGGLGKQLDMATKGVFILINDFDTMCQMVRRLHDEVEHRKSVADICVRNRKFELLREVVREFRDEEPSFMEQLEELEGHIYLCLLTINRSRRLVIQEIIATQK
ncbi:hypothetical protein L484_014327 [Morus notabilis]|uniref:Uncharacterized protein n=1 Tax=Morus notabilis TaxID=981085 RepID=W9RME2_9ROSA|nr:UPF0496 protein At1g20180 [Morus notabilis]EXB81519.1 hypothetical protein L484_014327 [Morus notabilis]